MHVLGILPYWRYVAMDHPIGYHFWVKTYRVQYIAIYWLDLVVLKIIENRCFASDFEGTNMIFGSLGGYFDIIVPHHMTTP